MNEDEIYVEPKCPECKIIKLTNHIDESTGFTQKICWGCGYYSSNSPAYKTNPTGFKNLIREMTPVQVLKIWGRKKPDDTPPRREARV